LVIRRVCKGEGEERGGRREEGGRGREAKEEGFAGEGLNRSQKFNILPEIDKAVREGFDVINVDTWLPVIPQIIARLHMRNIKAGIDQLLNVILKKHVQALVFPITVAHKVFPSTSLVLPYIPPLSLPRSSLVPPSVSPA
jgi:hypothetical protein